MHGKCTFAPARFFWQTDKNFLWLLWATATGWGTGNAGFPFPKKVPALPVHPPFFRAWDFEKVAVVCPAAINEKSAAVFLNTGVYRIKVYLYKKGTLSKGHALYNQVIFHDQRKYAAVAAAAERTNTKAGGSTNGHQPTGVFQAGA
jgi:hypothetical protein